MQESSSVLANTGKSRQFDQVVIDFLQKSGHIVLISPDVQFSALLRRTLSRHIGLNPDQYTTHVEVEQAGRALRSTCARHDVLLIIERVIEGHDINALVRQIKKTYTTTKIIVISQETDKSSLVLLHELGADNFITKPISVNGLVEKMAFTLKPIGKFGQMMDNARAMLARSRPQETLDICRQALEMKPGSAAAFLVSGDAYLTMKNYDAAFDCYDEAHCAADMYLAPIQKLAELCAVRGDTDGALHYLEELDRLSPLNAERKLKIGEVYLRKGLKEKALDIFETTLSQSMHESGTQAAELASRIALVFGNAHPVESESFANRAKELRMRG